jgi:hypothetical protein
VKCKKCGGRGRHGTEMLYCDDCNRKGWFTCKACKRGTVPCFACAERPVTPVFCPHCKGGKKHPCNGCTAGSYLAWERTAEWSLELNHFDQARAFGEAARLRCRQRYYRAVEALDTGEDHEQRKKYIRVIEEERDQELARLDGFLKDVDTAEEAAGNE